MPSEFDNTTISKTRLWTGRVLSFLPAAMLLLDGVMKIIKPEPVVKATVELGFPEAALIPLGIVLSLSVLLYLYSKTEIIGAILITGYLGGAVATHVFAKHGAFEIVFPVVFGALIWLGLVLRNDRLMALMPWRR